MYCATAVPAPPGGDSGVIDAVGFGAQAFSLTSQLTKVFKP